MKYLLLPLILTGCVGLQVPANKLSIETPRGKVLIEHPQNTKLTEAVFTVSTNGDYSVKIGSLETVNNPEVIDKTSAGQVRIIKAQADAAVQLIQTGVDAGAKAAVKAAK